MDYLQISQYSKTPKYKQIINGVISAIEQGKLKVGDKLMSINELQYEWDISRDTAVKAYEHLKSIGVIASVRGKGYYVQSHNFKQKAKVFLLFNKLSTHKKIIYDAFAQTLGDQASIDFFIYHNDFRLFKQLIQERLHESYTHFVVIMHFLEGGMHADEVIRQIPSEKLILLDKKIADMSAIPNAVYQDFAGDIYQALEQALERLRQYQTLRLIFPLYTYHALEILDGFESFCSTYAFPFDIVKDIGEAELAPGEVFVSLMEDDLVTLIKRIKAQGLKVGEEVGILSYNETPLKEILLDGISVMSTDFKALGETAARMVLGEVRGHKVNAFQLLLRNSL